MYQVKEYIAQWLCISFIWFIAIVSGFEIGFLILHILLLLFLSANGISKKSLAVPKLIILSIVFQNTIVGFAAHISGNTSNNINIFTQTTFLIILLSSAIILLYEFKDKKYILFWAYLLIILFYCVIGNVRDATVILYSVRNLITFYLVFVIGSYCIDCKEKLLDMIKFYINICVITGVFGCIAYIIGKDIYNFLGIKEIYDIKSFDGNYMMWRDGLPGNFYGEFFGNYIVRMASFFLEPVNLSPFIALGAILSACNLRKYKLQFVFLLFCNILTFGKGGLLILCVTLVIVLIGNALIKLHRLNLMFLLKMLKIGLVAAATSLAALYWILYSSNYHFQTIRATINVLLSNPLGFGVGTVGNVSAAAGVSDNMFIGAETGLLNFWCQIGIFGLIVFLMILFKMSKNVVYSWKNDDLINYRIAFMCLPIILAFEFLFQENTFTVQVISGFMLFQGYFSSQNKIQLEKNEVKT